MLTRVRPAQRTIPEDFPTRNAHHSLDAKAWSRIFADGIDIRCVHLWQIGVAPPPAADASTVAARNSRGQSRQQGAGCRHEHFTFGARTGRVAANRRRTRRPGYGEVDITAMETSLIGPSN